MVDFDIGLAHNEVIGNKLPFLLRHFQNYVQISVNCVFLSHKKMQIFFPTVQFCAFIIYIFSLLCWKPYLKRSDAFAQFPAGPDTNPIPPVFPQLCAWKIHLRILVLFSSYLYCVTTTYQGGSYLEKVRAGAR